MDNNRKSLRGEDHKQPGFFAHFQTAGHSDFINDTEIRFIDKTDPSDPTRREDFWIDTLKTRYLQSLNNIDLYHQLFIVFAVLLVSTVFTENVYFCSFRIFFFYIDFIIYGSLLFAISPLVRQVTMLSPSEDFF